MTFQPDFRDMRATGRFRRFKQDILHLDSPVREAILDRAYWKTQHRTLLFPRFPSAWQVRAGKNTMWVWRQSGASVAPVMRYRSLLVRRRACG